MPVHAHHRFDGGAVTPDQPLVGHEQDRVAVVLQAGVNAGKVCLGEFDQFVFVFPDDSLATRTVQVCLHVAAFPFTFLAAFICFLYERTLSSELASAISATDR